MVLRVAAANGRDQFARDLDNIRGQGERRAQMTLSLSKWNTPELFLCAWWDCEDERERQGAFCDQLRFIHERPTARLVLSLSASGSDKVQWRFLNSRSHRDYCVGRFLNQLGASTEDVRQALPEWSDEDRKASGCPPWLDRSRASGDVRQFAMDAHASDPPPPHLLLAFFQKVLCLVSSFSCMLTSIGLIEETGTETQAGEA